MLQSLQVYFGQQETLARQIEEVNNAQQSRSALPCREEEVTNQSERVDQAPHLVVGQQGQQQGNRQRSGWC